MTMSFVMSSLSRCSTNTQTPKTRAAVLAATRLVCAYLEARPALLLVALQASMQRYRVVVHHVVHRHTPPLPEGHTPTCFKQNRREPRAARAKTCKTAAAAAAAGCARVSGLRRSSRTHRNANGRHIFQHKAVVHMMLRTQHLEHGALSPVCSMQRSAARCVPNTYCVAAPTWRQNNLPAVAFAGRPHIAKPCPATDNRGRLICSGTRALTFRAHIDDIRVML